MVREDFSDFRLNRKERTAMRLMRLHIHVKVNAPVKALIAFGFADYAKSHIENHTRVIDSDRAKLTEKGLAYMEYCQEEFIKNYLFDIVNFFVALAALILSILK